MKAGFMSWLDLRCVPGDTLVCPVKVLFDDYRRFCWDAGFDRAGSCNFVMMLGSTPGVKFKEGGRGRRRQCATGIGLRPDGTLSKETNQCTS